MAVNLGAEEGLKAFITALNPGYALLIDGPWGSGKTHFVKRVCATTLSPTQFRYVSLNGVTDSAGFRRALLLDDVNAGLGQAASTLAKALGKAFKVEDLGPMAERAIEQSMMLNLPNILVFDDLERTTLSAVELVGLISAFVEQEGKKVVLLAATEEHPMKEDFIKRKDKIIGRTLSIEPNFDEAFPFFIQRIGDQNVKEFLESKQEDIKQVFINSEYHNLRLLRNALVDFGLVAEKIRSDLFSSREAMARFLRTYIALHMAFGKGDLTKKDLQERANWKVFRPGDSEPVSHLRRMHTKHQGADIVAMGGSVMSVDCGVYLLSSGHLDAHKLNNLLMSGGQFAIPTDENPLWKRLVHWGRTSWEDVDSLIAEGMSYLRVASPIDPGPFLHISDTLMRIAQFGGLSTTHDDLKNFILRRITVLSKRDGIPEAKLGIGMGWGMLGGTFSYGGYGCEPSPEFLEIIRAMESAQVSAYRKTEAVQAQQLLETFSQDLSRFRLSISYENEQPTFHRVPIMQLVKIKHFAKVVVDNLLEGKVEELGDIFEKLAERHNSENDWDQEKKWFQRLRVELERLARSRSKVARAHLSYFFRFYWKFSPPA